MKSVRYYYQSLLLVAALTISVAILPIENCGIKVPLVYLAVLKLIWSNCEAERLKALDGRIVEFPFRRDRNGFMIVEASIDGKDKHEFLFDTGMCYLCVSNQISRELILLPGTRTKSPAGPELTCGLLKSFSIGELTFRLPWAVSFPPSELIENNKKISGIIGSALFSGFEVTIDNGRGMICIKKASPSGSRNWPTFRSRESYEPFIGPNIFLKGMVDDTATEFYLDSGFNSNLIPPFEAQKLTGSHAQPVTGVVTDWYKNANMGIFLAQKLSLGNHVFKTVPFYVVLPDRNWSASVPTDSQVILGNWFLQRTRLISIDYPNKRILIEPKRDSPEEERTGESSCSSPVLQASPKVLKPE